MRKKLLTYGVFLVGALLLWKFGIFGAVLGVFGGASENEFPVSASGGPVRITEIVAGDTVKLGCSGETTILVSGTARGTSRISSGCMGLEARPAEMAADDPRGWPAPNFPVMAAMCTFIRYGQDFRDRSDWRQANWDPLNYRNFLSSSSMNVLEAPYDGWVYCWMNRPFNSQQGRPNGYYMIKLHNQG